jgi:hypothetical protein
VAILNQGVKVRFDDRQNSAVAPPTWEQVPTLRWGQVRYSTVAQERLANACNYAPILWPRLTRFLEHPQLELSNNWVENSMRPVALGRKNWINIGSQEAGPRVAAILSLVEPVDASNYRSVNTWLPSCPDWPTSRPTG